MIIDEEEHNEEERDDLQETDNDNDEFDEDDSLPKINFNNLPVSPNGGNYQDPKNFSNGEVIRPPKEKNSRFSNVISGFLGSRPTKIANVEIVEENFNVENGLIAKSFESLVESIPESSANQKRIQLELETNLKPNIFNSCKLMPISYNIEVSVNMPSKTLINAIIEDTELSRDEVILMLKGKMVIEYEKIAEDIIEKHLLK